jgi:hypothetical protein
MYQTFIIPYLYETQHVSDGTPPIIRSLKLHWQPLVFYTWKVDLHVVVGRCQPHCAWQRPKTTRPTTFHVWKTRGCHCSFRLLMMGGVLPDTCWASYKYGIIKFWYIVASCWIFLKELITFYTSLIFSGHPKIENNSVFCCRMSISLVCFSSVQTFPTAPRNFSSIAWSLSGFKVHSFTPVTLIYSCEHTSNQIIAY